MNLHTSVTFTNTGVRKRQVAQKNDTDRGYSKANKVRIVDA